MSNKVRKARNFAALSGGALVVAAPFVTSGAAGAASAEFTVENTNDSGPGSLRKAIEDANLTADVDTIVFDDAVTGSITLTSGQLEISESVNIDGPGASVLAIDGNDNDAVFYVYKSSGLISVSISGLTVTGGSSDYAGGMISWGETLDLEDMVITGNTGAQAGGVQFYGNYSDDHPTLTIRNSTISGNDGTGWGGGIYLYGAGQDGSTGVLIENSTISGNTASGHGGGLYLDAAEGDVIIRNSTISGNSADNTGGGIYITNAVTGNVVIENSTITDNTADQGGGIFLISAAETPVHITNSIVAGNTATTVAPADSANGNDIYSDTGTVSVDYSLIGDAGGHDADGTGNLSGDAMLGALADNGGATETHLPQAGSPVIDAGDTAYAGSLTNDQRGLTRVSGGRIDMGAVEVQSATLPPTGGSNGLMAAMGAGLLALGGALHLTGRRKRTA